MSNPASWEFHKRGSDKTLWVHLCPKGNDLSGVAIRLNYFGRQDTQITKCGSFQRKNLSELKRTNYFNYNFNFHRFILSF